MARCARHSIDRCRHRGIPKSSNSFLLSLRTPLNGFGPSLPSTKRPVSVLRFISSTVRDWIRQLTASAHFASAEALPSVLGHYVAPPALWTVAVRQPHSIEQVFVLYSPLLYWAFRVCSGDSVLNSENAYWCCLGWIIPKVRRKSSSEGSVASSVRGVERLDGSLLVS